MFFWTDIFRRFLLNYLYLLLNFVAKEDGSTILPVDKNFPPNEWALAANFFNASFKIQMDNRIGQINGVKNMDVSYSYNHCGISQHKHDSSSSHWSSLLSVSFQILIVLMIND